MKKKRVPKRHRYFWNTSKLKRLCGSLFRLLSAPALFETLSHLHMSTRVTLLVTGARAWTDYELLKKSLSFVKDQIADDIHTTCIEITLVHGGAYGADSLADRAAKEFGWKTEVHRVTSQDWNTYGKRAGFLRNVTMIEKTQPDYAAAFYCGESRGTNHCVQALQNMKNSSLALPVFQFQSST